jgi:hypothetical protein
MYSLQARIRLSVWSSCPSIRNLLGIIICNLMAARTNDEYVRGTLSRSVKIADLSRSVNSSSIVPIVPSKILSNLLRSVFLRCFCSVIAANKTISPGLKTFVQSHGRALRAVEEPALSFGVEVGALAAALMMSNGLSWLENICRATGLAARGACHDSSCGVVTTSLVPLILIGGIVSLPL